jgi:asparagine synthase (glutamine-hydrolysing)
VPAPWSIYEGVSKLPPGHLLVWQDGRTEVRPYWRLDFTPRVVADEEAEAERLRELLLEAVRIRMVSERPLGAFLSGGIDSAAVVAAMAQSSGERVKTFSIGFDDPDFDERRYARAVATRYGTDHHELVVQPQALDILPTLAWHFDEPFADSSAIPSFYVAQMSRQQVTVVLTGDGGDEAFGGYTRYELMAKMGRLPVPRWLGPALVRIGTGIAGNALPGSRRSHVGLGLEMLGQPPSRRYAPMMAYFRPDQKLALYTDELRAELAGIDSYRLLDEAFAASRADTAVGRAIDADVNAYLPGDLLPKVDISTMANSLEARSPFLDHVLMEWAAGLPTRLKVRRESTKYLLRKAVSPWLPPELMDRPKMGFRVPLESWLRGELRGLARDVLTDATARGRGLFRPDVVARMLREHDEGANHASRIWALIQFELWHRMFIDAPTAPSRPDDGLVGVHRQ